MTTGHTPSAEENHVMWSKAPEQLQNILCNKIDLLASEKVLFLKPILGFNDINWSFN